jgi:hypothetical protein
MDAISGPDVEKNADGNVVVHGKTYAVWSSKIPIEGRGSLTGVDVLRKGAVQGETRERVRTDRYVGLASHSEMELTR